MNKLKTEKRCKWGGFLLKALQHTNKINFKLISFATKKVAMNKFFGYFWLFLE